MSTYRSPVTSWAMSSSGNSGARSAGPTGCSVPGCSGGGGGVGRSGTTLYHRVGSCDSSSRILCCRSAMASPSGLARASAAQRSPRVAWSRGRVDETAADPRRADGDVDDLAGRRPERVPAELDEVREHAGSQGALHVLLARGVRGAARVQAKGLGHGDPLAAPDGGSVQRAPFGATGDRGQRLVGPARVVAGTGDADAGVQQRPVGEHALEPVPAVVADELVAVEPRVG